MLQIDVLSSFAICGAGACVGAAMLRPNLAHDAAAAESLRFSRAAFAVIGAGLLQPLVQDRPLPLWSQALMAAGAVLGVLIVGGSAARLAGQRALLARLAAGLALAVAPLLALLPLGTPGVTAYCALGLGVASTVTAWMGRRLVLRPRDRHERLVGLTIGILAASSWLRASFVPYWPGPYADHLMYMPPALVTPFTLMYGVLPVLFAMLLLNVVNARLQARLHQRAMTDHLTGALSRHALVDGAAQLIERLRGASLGLAVAMIDLDHFKSVNDRHGHAAGDAVLRRAAALLQTQLRPDALLVRYGGEEFLALVPVENLPVARRVAERMREAIAQAAWHDVAPGLGRVTASVGVTLLGPDEPLEVALERADQAQYRAKNGGRNQVQMGLSAA
jgi:diguanylate cyclase (GGDEF)-like protein